MKKFLWITGMFIVAAIVVYITSPSGRNFRLPSLKHAGGFEAIFDSAAKEIAASEFLKAPAVFTVSSFVNGYSDNKELSGLIASEMRNSLAQCLPGRVTAYSNFKFSGTRNSPDKTATDKETNAVKTQKETAAVKKDTEGPAAAENISEKSGTAVPVSVDTTQQNTLLKNSGNFIISGTYKEDEGELIISLYVSDAENGRGYYARRLSLPMEKLPIIYSLNEKNSSDNEKGEDEFSGDPLKNEEPTTGNSIPTLEKDIKADGAGTADENIMEKSFVPDITPEKNKAAAAVL
jgi:hypothetical protein